MALLDVLVPLALIAILILCLRLAGGGDVWPVSSASRFDLGWPRGVQEEEPVHFRTEQLGRRGARAATC